MEILYELRDQYKRIANTLDDVKAKLYALKHPDENFIDNDEFLRRLNISKRTAQNWRDKGLIDYCQVGSKIFYSTTHIATFMKKHEVKVKIKRGYTVDTP